VKQASAHSKIKALGRTSKVGGNKRPGSSGVPNGLRTKSNPDPSQTVDDPDFDRSSQDELNIRIKELPKEVGVMLVTAGIVGLILPGPGTPAIIAGGLALWPSAFSKLESWLERRHPRVHRESMKQIGRFLNDLEKRYPYTGRD
jgi:Putative transmembrane protein (PGPGW)